MPNPEKKNSTRGQLLLWLACITAVATFSAAALDSRYTDADGDLVADTPAATVDPATLIFAYTPGEDPAHYPAVWDDFTRHLEQATGKRVRFYPAQSNAAQIEAMRAGRLHIAAFGTGTVPIAVNCAGFVPFAIMGGEKGILGYQMELITHPGSGITRPADLKGRKLAFTSPTSNSGFKAASVMLRSEFGLEAGRDYTAVFSGRHENSVLGVASKDYEAAAIANDVMRRMIQKGEVKSEQIVSVYRSETFPTAAFGHAHNLDPKLAASIRRGFFSFAWAGTSLAKEFAPLDVSKFIPITYKDQWALVRRIDALMNVNYACR